MLHQWLGFTLSFSHLSLWCGHLHLLRQNIWSLDLARGHLLKALKTVCRQTSGTIMESKTKPPGTPKKHLRKQVKMWLWEVRWQFQGYNVFRAKCPCLSWNFPRCQTEVCSPILVAWCWKVRVFTVKSDFHFKILQLPWLLCSFQAYCCIKMQGQIHHPWCHLSVLSLAGVGIHQHTVDVLIVICWRPMHRYDYVVCASGNVYCQ